MIFKKYRLKKLNQRLSRLNAKYSELKYQVSLIKGTNSYYIDTAISYKGDIAELEYQIKQMDL